MIKKTLPLILKIAVIIFIVEFTVMWSLSAAAIANRNIEILIDSIFLTLFSAPLIYLWIIKPYVSGRDLAEEALRLSETVFDITDMGITITNANREIIAVNPAFSKITGFGLEEVIGKNPRLLSSGKHDKEFYQAMWSDINTTGGWKGEIWNRRKNGEIYTEWLSIKVVANMENEVSKYVAVFYDLSEQIRLQHIAHHDSLTGLPNRIMLNECLETAISEAKYNQARISLMFLDLDHFKQINDSLGHDIGDLLLTEAAKRLKDSVRASDTVARIGGDEFVVLFPFIENESDVKRVADKILHALAQPFELASQTLHISASIGYAIYPEQGNTAEQLKKNADVAMYHAKNNGRNRAESCQI